MARHQIFIHAGHGNLDMSWVWTSIFITILWNMHGFIVFGDTDMKHAYVVASSDGSVSLTCDATNFTKAQFHWKFNRTGSTEAEAIILYNGKNVHVSYLRFKVTNPTPRSSVLSFRGARLTDAGTYICDIIADKVKERYRTLSLIVEDVPVFYTTVTNGGILVEGDIIQFQCSVAYQGSLDPEVTWHMIDSSRTLDPPCSIPAAQRTTPSKDDAKQIESLLTLKVDSCHSGTRIECSVSFQIPERTVDVDRSINGSLISPPLFVITPPKTITFDSRRDEYVPDDVITCSTDGNSEPNFEWTDLMSGRVISQDSRLRITEEMSNYSLVNFSCTAVLRIANHSNDWRISRSVRFKVSKLYRKGLKAEALKKVVLFVVILIATVTVAVVMVVSCFIARRRSERKKERKKLEKMYSLPTESGGDSAEHTDNVHGNILSARQEQFVDNSHTMGIQLERVAPKYANIASLGPNQAISDDSEDEHIEQVGNNSVSILHTEETVEHVVVEDGNSRPYENVSNYPYANVDLSQSHTAAGVVNKTNAEQPLNSMKKSTEGSFDKGICLYSNSDIPSSACDQQTYVNIVGGTPKKRPNDYMSLDETRESSSLSIYTTLTPPME